MVRFAHRQVSSAAKHCLRADGNGILLGCGTDIGCEGDFGGLPVVQAAESTRLRDARQGNALWALPDAAGSAGPDDPCGNGLAV
jgi:hypothetical protein